MYDLITRLSVTVWRTGMYDLIIRVLVTVWRTGMYDLVMRNYQLQSGGLVCTTWDWCV